MAKAKHSAKILAAVAKVTKKRGKILVEHILKHGSVSTEELETIYGLTDAASAARDVRDAGVPLAKTSGKRRTGRQMAIYKFGDPSLIRGDRFQGRRAFAKGFKETLINKYGSKCALCSTPYEPRYLQIDHRVPYQIAGEALVKVKSDPKLVAAAREWRDRWLERVNAGQYLPAAEGKYEVSRALSDAGAGQVEHAMPRLAGPGSTGSAQAMAA